MLNIYASTMMIASRTADPYAKENRPAQAHEPEPRGGFAMAGFWPARLAAASAPKASGRVPTVPRQH